MSDGRFFDTNLLLYADDHDAPEKQRIATELIEAGRRERWGVLSIQVLQEYFVNATRKLGLPVSVARRKVELYGHFRVVLPDMPLVLGAVDLHEQHGVSFWDALVVEAASAAVVPSCTVKTCKRIDALAP